MSAIGWERKFLYCCYRSVLTGKFDRFQKNIFYAYLIMRTDFRGELIQSNKKIGFGNFSDYQDRKEFFIEGHKPYEDELVRLALNESLTKKNMLSLEARICPKNTSAKLIKMFCISLNCLIDHLRMECLEITMYAKWQHARQEV